MIALPIALLFAQPAVVEPADNPTGFFEPGGFLAKRANKVGFFFTLQGGTIFGLGISDIGPRNGKPDYFAQADLLAGVSF